MHTHMHATTKGCTHVRTHTRTTPAQARAHTRMHAPRTRTHSCACTHMPESIDEDDDRAPQLEVTHAAEGNAWQMLAAHLLSDGHSAALQRGQAT